MKNSFQKKNEAKQAFLVKERRSKRISERFPDVAHIMVRIKYTSDGTLSLVRTLNFYPESHSFFKMNCLGEGCDYGGLNLTRAITSMIKNRTRSTKGDLQCTNKDTDAVHAGMSYSISIKYI